MENLKILTDILISDYCEQINENFLKSYLQLRDSELSLDTFSFYTSVSAVYSSKIEGEDIDLDSYVKHKRFGVAFLTDYTQKIDDLYNAYQFAKSHPCNKTNIDAIHKLLTSHILPQNRQGQLRIGNMYVTSDDGRIEYVAAPSDTVQHEMTLLYADLSTLLSNDLAIQEVFYYAALLHLVFVKIHPFYDGNGRTGRLIEKWFLAEKLGPQAWLIQSERCYYQHHQTYYHNLRRLGLEYPLLDYSRALPFLLMLPQALTTENN